MTSSANGFTSRTEDLVTGLNRISLSLKKQKKQSNENMSTENLSSNASNNSISTTRRKTKFKRRTIKLNKEVKVYDNFYKQLEENGIIDYWEKYNEPGRNFSDLNLEKIIKVSFKNQVLYIKFTRNKDEIIISVNVDESCSEECCNFSYEIENKSISMNSILFENDEKSKCRGTPEHVLSGTFYIELFISLTWCLAKMGLEINECSLEDSASIPNPITYENVSLSIIKLFDDCRTFYEGYGFFPTLGYTTNEYEDNIDYEFMSDEYITALQVLVSDRIILFSKPIRRVIKLIEARTLFRIDESKILNVSLYSDEDTYNLVLEDLKSLYETIKLQTKRDGLDYNNISLNEIYEYANANKNKFLVKLIIGFISFPLENITGNKQYYFPISAKISHDKLDRTLAIYSKKHIQIYEKPIRTLFAAKQ